MKKFIYSILTMFVALGATSCNEESKGIDPSNKIKQNYIVQFVPAAKDSWKGEYTAFAEFVPSGSMQPIPTLPKGSWVKANNEAMDCNYSPSFNYGTILPNSSKPESVTFVFRKNDISTFTNVADMSMMPTCSLKMEGEGEVLKMDTPYEFEFDGPGGSTIEVLLIPATGATISAWYKATTKLSDNTYRFASSSNIPAGPYYLRAVAKYRQELQDADNNAGGSIELHYVSQRNVVVQ